MSTFPSLTKSGLSTKSLARLIFTGQAPENLIRSLPAQSLYMVLLHNTLDSSADIIELAEIEQCRLLTDFDLWHGDRFEEENIWSWLSLPDQNENLGLLQKLVNFLDLKIVALLCARHVDSLTFEEGTDNPPAPGFSTPDGGRTWIRINLEDGRKNFLLARLLALIFEANADLFYQLIFMPNLATESALEEEAYTDRVKRLEAEGIPSAEVTAEIHSPLRLKDLEQELSKPRAKTIDISPVTPLVYDTEVIRPLGDLLAQLKDPEEFELELTWLMNSSVVRWGLDFSQIDEIRKLSLKIKGAINIGLELVSDRTKLETIEVYNRLGLIRIYRLGFGQILELRKEAGTISEITNAGNAQESAALAVLEGLKRTFPEVPAWLGEDGSVNDTAGSLAAEYRAISSAKELADIRKYLGKFYKESSQHSEKKR